MPLQIIYQDITEFFCDAIVNPTDCSFSGGGGTDLAVHTAAGIELDAACRQLDPLRTGEVAVTGGYALPCKYIIHTMGPVWHGGNENEVMLLRSCYLNALFKAKSLGARSIAFPLISAGTFGFPKDRVLKIATDTISEFLLGADSELNIFICVHDSSSFEVSRSAALREFLDSIDFFPHQKEREYDANVYDAVVEDVRETREDPTEDEAIFASEKNAAFRPYPMPMEKRSGGNRVFPSLSEWIKKKDKSFSEMLLDLIREKGMKEVDCYKRANVSKNTFSKIKNAGKPVPYQPSKPTVIAFAIALQLNMEETQQLLKSAGFTMSRNNLFDLIIEFYITQGIYDIFEINAALYQYDQVCLGC